MIFFSATLSSGTIMFHVLCFKQFLVAKDIKENEGTCIGVCKKSLNNTDYQTSSDMYLYRAYNGSLYHNGEKTFTFQRYTQGDYVTCRYNKADRTLAFGLNGEEPRIAFDDLPSEPLYPFVLFYSLSPAEKVCLRLFRRYNDIR